MISNSFKIKKYLDKVGFYAMIDMEIKVEDLNVLNIQYDKSFIDEEWLPAIEFGIKYVYEHYSKDENKGFSVFVKKLNTMTGDSSLSIVLYVSIKCLIEALGYTKKQLINMDEKTGEFILSK